MRLNTQQHNTIFQIIPAQIEKKFVEKNYFNEIVRVVFFLKITNKKSTKFSLDICSFLANQSYCGNLTHFCTN